MAGFEVVDSGGSVVVVSEATSYGVADDGSLMLSADGAKVRVFRGSEWTMVRRLGVQLTNEPWPPAELDEILLEIHNVVCVGQGYCDSLGTSASFAEPHLNDLEGFTAEILSRLGVHEGSPGYREVIAAVDEGLSRRFRLDR